MGKQGATKCPKCHLENTSDSKFCKECGTQLIPSDEVSPSITKTLETPVTRLAIGSIFAGRYEILEELGKGGMGEVYRVKDEKLDEEMALKVLKPEIAAYKGTLVRFKNELKLARKITHKNVCRMYDLNEEEAAPYITMEYVKGKDLKSFIREKGRLTQVEAITIAKQVCEGLAGAHELGIVHRDLKPQNIMIDEKGNAKVMDFGIARSVDAPGVTATGMMIGTPDYISPEQAEGAELDQRTDIYSLGIILYEMVTGGVPFEGDTALSVAIKHKTKIPRNPRKLNPEISEDLSRLILICMQKDRESRYQTAEVLLSDLRNIEESFPLGTKIRPRRETFAARLIQKKLFFAVLVAVLAIVLVVVWLIDNTKQAGLVSQNRKQMLVVAYFENQTNQSEYDYMRKVLMDMLITDLSHSKYLDVIPYPRIRDILKYLGNENDEVMELARSFDVCDLAQAEVLVTGSLAKSGSTFVINSHIYDVDTQKQLFAYRVTGQGEDNILGHMVDDLTDEIKKGLKISINKVREEELALMEVTTSSLDAYKNCFEGREAAYLGYHREAVSKFKKALSFDPQYSGAYEGLVRSYYTLGEYNKSLEALEKVKLHSRKLTEERFLDMLALEAFLKEDWDQAIKYYKEITQINPKNLHAHVDLGLVFYQKKFMYKEGIREFRTVLDLDPRAISNSTKFTYNVLGWACLRSGSYLEAQKMFEKYESFYPNQAYPQLMLADFHSYIGNYDVSVNYINRGIDIDANYPDLYRTLSDICLSLGMFAKAEESLNKYLSFSLSDSKRVEGHYALSLLFYIKGDYSRAIEESQKSLKLNQKFIKSHWVKGLSFIEENKLKQAEHEIHMMELLFNEQQEDMKNYHYLNLMGKLKLSQGHKKMGLNDLAESAAHSRLDQSYFLTDYGHACFNAGEVHLAIDSLESVFNMNPNYARAHYLLGLISEHQGNTTKAIEHLEKFLTLWKDADPGIAEVDDARKRLAGLKVP